MVWKAIRTETRLKRAVPCHCINIATGVDGRRGPARPERARISIGREIKNPDLRKRRFIVTHHPPGVGPYVAVRRPAQIDDAAIQDQAGTLLILLRIENHVDAVAVVARAGISCRNVNGPPELLRPGFQIERV